MVDQKQLLSGIVVVAVAAVLGYLLYASLSSDSSNGGGKSASYAGSARSRGPSQIRPASYVSEQGRYPSQDAPVDMLQGGRRRSMKATGYSQDGNVGCYNENLVGSVQAPYDTKTGSSRCSFPSQPIGSKPVPLAPAKRGDHRLAASRTGGKGPSRTGIDLSQYSRMGTDRAMGAQGLDQPEDLALSSALLGHIEVTEPTITDSTHPFGETASSWQVGYSVNTSGNIEPGNGHISQIGPYMLQQRIRGAPY